jgi:hypothetical protein
MELISKSTSNTKFFTAPFMLTKKNNTCLDIKNKEPHKILAQNRCGDAVEIQRG